MNIGFNIYILFAMNWFLHLPARIPSLGVVRIDLLLIVIMTAIILCSTNQCEEKKVNIPADTNKILKVLICYIVLTLPFVEWPGSVINKGAESFVKAIVFFYFTIYFITTEDKLKKFVTMFILCQTFRIIEPLYLHITKEYWGASASMGTGGWDIMNRLSGAPNDIVNPNGLAFIIITVIPFYYYLSTVSKTNTILSLVMIPVLIYTLLLTGSRSGMMGLFVIAICILFKSGNKIIILLMICVISIVGYTYTTDNLKDRYASIFVSNTKNSATAEGRIEGVKSDFIVAMRRPLFGHGLGTSRESNANYGGVDKPSHNLYTEVAQELGLVGVVIFICFIKSIINTSKKTLYIINNKLNNNYLLSINNSMQVWLYMNILFSFASYGLSSYSWYLFAGMSISLSKITEDLVKRKKMICT